MPVTSYSTVAANNNSAAPNGAPEGWAPSAVNDTIRQIMADIAVEAQKNSVKVLGSVAGTANAITAGMSPALAAYSAGMLVVLTPASANTAGATLNVDSIGALDVFRYGGEALHAGDLAAGVPAYLLLDSGADDFYLLNPQNTGFRNIQQNTQTGNYTCVLADAGKSIVMNGTDLTLTLPANASVAYPLGTVIVVVNKNSTDLTVALTSDTLVLAGTTSTGSRTLSVNGIATAYKSLSTEWLISGTGLS